MKHEQQPDDLTLFEEQGTPRNDRTVGTNTEQGKAAYVGFSNPGSPLDEKGLDPLPKVGGPGAADPNAGDYLEGDDEGHDRGIAVDQDTPVPLRVSHTTERTDDTPDAGTSGGSSSW